ncbi:MAG: O-acetylhomoserine aminocarboxypropyltransferase/cysteine synthase [Spirochaetaceae bacterium]|nr:O-acetylhomoserine aminocarboxypropyltransferase/cysteine synthase [Spirochaetaceae bacterium]RKX98966.1 MAG: bifunctional O-acetylhomoserine aminocarboxypropyltransferase/cysteine synthase [Spirochaetota bacterium]
MGFSTKAIHEGWGPENSVRAVPIHRTTAYNFRDTTHASDLFALKELGHIYTRLNNPTQDVLETRMAALEGGTGALALSSGTAAIFNSIINVANHGDEIVASSELYGGTYTQFKDILPQFGINVNFVNPHDISAWKAASNEKTRAFYYETIGNPSLKVPDFLAIKEVAEEIHVPIIVDATFTTPYLFNPIEYGADIVVHSLTKWIGGHGTAIGGIVVESGKFDWTDPKFSTFNEPDTGYHGLRYAHDLGDLSPIAFVLRMRLVQLRNLGACLSPDNEWMFLQGLETLALRMERHSSNASTVAEFLSNHPAVSWVRYPGLEKGNGNYPIAAKYLKKGFGGMVVFGIKGGREAGAKFIESLELFSHVANVGDAKSLAIHPASTTHSQLSEEDLTAAGAGADLIRLSIGIEDAEDILADLETSLKN